MADIFGWYDDLLANRYAPQSQPPDLLANQAFPPGQPAQTYQTAPDTIPFNTDMTPTPDTGRGTYWDNARQAAGDIYRAGAGLAERANLGARNMLGLRAPGAPMYQGEIEVGPGLERAADVANFATGGLQSSLFPAIGAARYAAPAAREAGRDVLPMLQNVLADEMGGGRLPSRRAPAPAAALPELPHAVQQGPASNLGLAAPRIGMGSRGPIFDTSVRALSGVPDVPQSSLLRPDEFPRGLPDRYKVLGTEANLNRVDEAVKRGMEMPGGGGWYNTMQLLDRFVGEHGQERGTELWKRYMDYVAATSARTPVPENIRTASYLYALDQQGKPFPQGFARLPGENNARWIGEKPPSPYGMLPNNMQQALHIRSGRGLDPMTNPKISSFAENLQGNYAPLTADVHNLRLLGYPKDSPDLGGYRYIEDIQRRRAEALGLTPAQYQSSGWVGAANQTGVKGAGGTNEQPFLQRFESKLRDTAEATRLSPEDVLRQFIRGELMLR